MWQIGHSVNSLILVKVKVSRSLRPHGLYSLWNSLGKNTGVGSLSLLQGIFPAQGSNPGLPHCRRILYQLSYIRGFSGEAPSPLILGETQILWSPTITKHNRENPKQRDSLSLSLFRSLSLQATVHLRKCMAGGGELIVGQMRQMHYEPLNVGHSYRFCVFMAFQRLIDSN